MKTINSIGIAAISALSLFLVSCSSAPKDPQVTYMEEYTQGGIYYPNFGASQKYYVLYDGNRKCSKNSNVCFMVTKTNQIINSADRCDRCGHCWYVHEKK